MRVEVKTTGLQIPTQAKGTFTARFASFEPKQINYKLILRLQHFKATIFYFNKKHPKKKKMIRVICRNLGDALAKVLAQSLTNIHKYIQHFVNFLYIKI